MEINKFWELIQRYLHSEMEIRNWTGKNDYLKTNTLVNLVSKDRIVITTQNKRRKIPLYKDDFQYVLSVWNDYLLGRIIRSEMRWKSYKLTYILAITKYIFQNNKNS